MVEAERRREAKRTTWKTGESIFRRLFAKQAKWGNRVSRISDTTTTERLELE